MRIVPAAKRVVDILERERYTAHPILGFRLSNSFEGRSFTSDKRGLNARINSASISMPAVSIAQEDCKCTPLSKQAAGK